MSSPIRQGDPLENGGHVIAGSTTMQFMGKFVARLGDEALCAKHGTTTIVEGDSTFLDQDGKPVAMHLFRCACGCRLISSLSNVRVT